jgi:hypothetical protein
VRRRFIIVGAVFGASLAGCYALQPTGGPVPVVGTEVAFDLNDAGRVALGSAIGPEVAQIEGRLVDKQTNGDMTLAVTAVHTLQGFNQVWAGERVQVRPEYVSTVYEKKFSKGRPVVASAVAGGGFAAIITRSLIGSVNPEDGPAPGDTGHTVRIPHRSPRR